MYKSSICDSSGEPLLVLGRAVELVLVVAVHAQERPEALVDLNLERFVWVLLSVDGEVAVWRDGLDTIRVRLEIVLLREAYAITRHRARQNVGRIINRGGR